MMKARVVAQGATVVCMVATSGVLTGLGTTTTTTTTTAPAVGGKKVV